MPLTRLDYQRPDYLSQISPALDKAAKVANDYSPAHPAIQKAVKMMLSGEATPEQAAVLAKSALGPPPTPLTGGNVTFSGPQPGAPMGSVNAKPAPPAALPAPMPSAAPSSGGFTGPQEFTGPVETVTAPSPPRSGPMMSSPARDLSSLDAPILNKDVPQLLQVAGQMQKHDPMDTYMKLYALGLRGQALEEKYREFEAMQPVRQSMINQRDAGISNMPFKNQMAYGNLGQRIRANDISAGNLDTRRTENFLKGTAETAQAIPQLRSVINDLKMSPGVAPPDWDYATRKSGRIMGGLPFVGDALKEGMEAVADTALTPEQRQIRARIAQAVQPYRKLAVGSQITAGEFALIDQITGQGLGVGDQIAALMALERSMTYRQGRIEAGYPEMPGRIPMAEPGQVMPSIRNPYPTGFGGPENISPPQAPEGPSLRDELNSAPQNRRLRGTVTDEGIR